MTKFKRITYSILFLHFIFSNVNAQSKEWLLPIPGDPGLVEWHGNAYSFQTENYLCWLQQMYMPANGKQTLYFYNGTYWKKHIVDSLVHDIINMAEHNDTIVMITSHDDNAYGDRIIYHNGKKWQNLTKMDALEGNHAMFKRLGFQDVQFYQHKLYGIFLNDDYNSTLYEYSFKTDSLKAITTFQEHKLQTFYNQPSKMKLYVHKNKLFLCGAFDSVNHVAAQGFGYYDGTKFVNRKLFPSATTLSFTAVKPLEDDMFIVERGIVGGGNTNARMYLMRNDTIQKEITSNLFTGKQDNFGLIDIAQSSLQVLRFNGQITYFENGSAFYVYDEAKNVWKKNATLSVRDGYAYYFKNHQYILCADMTSPYVLKSNACFTVKNAYPVTGVAYVDMDTNCVVNQNDTLRKNDWVILGNDSITLSCLTDQKGAYELPIPQGKYWFKSNQASLGVSRCLNDTILVDTNFNYKRNIAYAFVSPFDKKGDAKINASGGLMRRGQNYQLTLHLENNGRPDLNCSVFINFNKKLNYLYSNLAGVSKTGNKLTIVNQKANFFKSNDIQLFFYVHPDSFKVLDNIEFNIAIDSLNTETTYANNYITFKDYVRGPYDPNTISSNPENTVFTSPHEMQYTIEFQNLGNDTAFNVRITDKIPAKFDWSSIKLRGHSGPNITASINNGLLEFMMKGIKLTPASGNISGSKGFVTFTLKLKDTLVIGQRIQNSAAIYFDYETEVLTNTTEVERIKPTSVIHKINALSAGFKVFPNPAGNVVNIQGMNATAISDIRFYTLTGQELKVTKLSENQFDISSLQPGLYLVNFKIEGEYYAYILSKVAN